MNYIVLPILSLFLLSLVSSSTSFNFTFPNISGIPPISIRNATKSSWNAFEKFSGCHTGQTVDGLSKLKQYLNHFGYIHDHKSFTDDFDDALETALKVYQKNFNLNQTGQLDKATIKQIQKPRCGNADVINGTSTMNLGKTSTGHLHNVGHYSFFRGQPRWSKDELTYAFSPENRLSNEVKAVFARAFTRWSKVIPMDFTETKKYNTAEIQIGFYEGDHGDSEPFDGPLGTLAHAFSPENGRFHLDGAEKWWISSGDDDIPSLSSIDLESVAVHEIGHLLGLGHSSDESAIMFPSISSGERKVLFASDDVEGIQVLYGSNPSYNGTNTTSSIMTKERETSGTTRKFHVRNQNFENICIGIGLLLMV